MSSAEPLQVEIARPAEEASADRWRSACRVALGLDAAAADLLRTRAPLTVHLLATPELRGRLERGLAGELRPSPLSQAVRCAAHPGALISEWCPRCQKASACGLCRGATSLGFCAPCTRGLRSRRRFRNVRVAILLVVLVAAALGTWSTHRKLHGWVAPLTIEVVPVVGEGDPAVARALAQLPSDTFEPVRTFLLQQAARYGRDLGGRIDVRCAAPISEQPLPPPGEGASTAAIALWSLELRAWDLRTAWRNRLAPADVRIYVVFRPVPPGGGLDASVGLEQGHVGIVQAPLAEADRGWTLLAVVHELMHTLGATDKYRDDDGLPRIPDGLADPDREPPEPQPLCEVMAGSVPVEVGEARLARSLEECVVNRFTAAEIGWLPLR